MANAVRRFVVLCGKDSSPDQGWYDYADSFDTREEALNFLPMLPTDQNDWWQILDLKTGDLELGRFNK